MSQYIWPDLVSPADSSTQLNDVRLGFFWTPFWKIKPIEKHTAAVSAFSLDVYIICAL